MTLGADIRAAYDAAGEAWASGPSTLYDELAVPLIEAVENPGGVIALDVGTGAGAVARLLHERGAAVLACDGSLGMLRAAGARRCFVGDVTGLPVADGAVDVATAGFVLNHLNDPEAGLRELGRVVRPGGQILASVFGGEAVPELKARIDEAAGRHGYVPPPWYDELKRTCFPLLETPDAFCATASAAGLVDPRAQVTHVTVTMSARDQVRWRLGMAHYAAFTASLDPVQRRSVESEAVAALTGLDAEQLFPVLVLHARR